MPTPASSHPASAPPARRAGATPTRDRTSAWLAGVLALCLLLAAVGAGAGAHRCAKRARPFGLPTLPWPAVHLIRLLR